MDHDDLCNTNIYVKDFTKYRSLIKTHKKFRKLLF